MFTGYLFSQKFSGGIVVSPMLSWMKPTVTKNIENESMKLGSSFGVTGDLNLSDNFALSLGLNVNNFGGKLKYLDSIPAFSVDKGSYDSVYSFEPGAIINYKMQYVEVPFYIKGKTNEIGYMTYYLKAGINPMFKWQTKADVTQGNIAGESIKKEVSGLVIGYGFGGGFEYSLGGNTKFIVELDYLNGLTDITKTKTYNTEAKKAVDDNVILNYIAIKTGIVF
ncbi:MAG: hypothetical protein Kow0068_04440 [Marinilabiliales bacterium]